MSDVLGELATWLGVNKDILGFVLGLVIIASVSLSIGLLADNAPVVYIAALVAMVFVILIGLWPTWVAFVIVLVGAILLLFGGGTKTSLGRGE